MMAKQGLKGNMERQQYAHDGREKDLRQRMIVGANASVGKNQGQKTIKSESLQKEGKALKWQRIVSRWWDLTFGNEGRTRKATGEISLLLEILGTSPKITKRKNRRKNEVSFF